MGAPVRHRLPSVPSPPRADHLRDCVVRNCGRACASRSNYCSYHKAKNRVYGNPTGHAPARPHVTPHRDLVNDMLAHGFGELHVVKKLEAYLVDMVHVPKSGMPRVLELHFDRMRTAGVTGRQMLIPLLALYHLRYHGDERLMHRSDVVFDAVVGNYLLRAGRSCKSRRPEWAKKMPQRYWRPDASTTVALGEFIRSRLGAPLLQVVNAMQVAIDQRLKIERALEETYQHAKRFGLPIPPEAVEPQRFPVKRKDAPKTLEQRVEALLPKRPHRRPTKAEAAARATLRDQLLAKLKAEDEAAQAAAAEAAQRAEAERLANCPQAKALRIAAEQAAEYEQFERDNASLLDQLARDRASR